ncbi:MAG: prepilin-type N-terminal cleavage/methylation domain-containing protein, partial [Pelagibacterales bacterium]|nr:prepilin-type N-terminal cleavage/methylation domain-containing protein [Pelagibacterales bacterium]
MMKKNFFNKVENRKAYTLLELAISILVISILITGALSMSVSRAGKKKIQITNQR